MNFFKLYIGDYQRDTAHLSVTEHGAYLLMLQHYYATEKPLPIGKALHRMLRAQDRVEREAIDAVAAAFWVATDGGLVNTRADEEIAKACSQADTNTRIAREREARRKAEREQDDQSTKRATNEQPNQTPDTRHHSQKESASALSARATTAAAVCIAIKAAGIQSVNPSHPRLKALIDAGATTDEFVGMADKAAGKANGFAYLLAAVEGERKHVAETVIHAGRLPNKQELLEQSNREIGEEWARKMMERESNAAQ